MIYQITIITFFVFFIYLCFIYECSKNRKIINNLKSILIKQHNAYEITREKVENLMKILTEIENSLE